MAIEEPNLALSSDIPNILSAYMNTINALDKNHKL